MPNIGLGGPVRPQKNCDLAQNEATFRQEGPGSKSIDFTVIQKLLSLFRLIFSNSIHSFLSQFICKIIKIL